MVVLMAGYNSISHGGQDLNPTFLKDQVDMGPTRVTVITIVGQIGALIGSTPIGYLGTFTGRRLATMMAAAIGGALVPSYILLRNDNLVATVFFEQFFVGGSWGSVPVSKRIWFYSRAMLITLQIHLIELSPPVPRRFMYGATYQLCNLSSAASSTIEATIVERFPLPPTATGVKRYDYGKVIGIFMGAVWAYIILFVFVGPEMSQEEREKEAAQTLEFERMRAAGVSLAEIGAGRAKGVDSGENMSDEKEQATVGYIEEAWHLQLSA